MRPRLQKMLTCAALAAAATAISSAVQAETFAYDALGRLTTVTVPGGSTGYTYDAADNWRSVASSGSGGMAALSGPAPVISPAQLATARPVPSPSGSDLRVASLGGGGAAAPQAGRSRPPPREAPTDAVPGGERALCHADARRPSAPSRRRLI